MVLVLNLDGYGLVLSKKVKKNLSHIEKNDSKAILKRLKMLIKGIKNIDVVKLNDCKVPTYRMRCGKYRAIFVVKHVEIVVLVVEIDHRKDVYKYTKRRANG